MKTYSSVAAAKKGIEKAGLHGCPVDYHIIRHGFNAGRVEPIVHVTLTEDFDVVTQRGFSAKMVPAAQGAK